MQQAVLERSSLSDISHNAPSLNGSKFDSIYNLSIKARQALEQRQFDEAHEALVYAGAKAAVLAEICGDCGILAFVAKSLNQAGYHALHVDPRVSDPYQALANETTFNNLLREALSKLRLKDLLVA